MSSKGESYLILGLGELGNAVSRGLAERNPHCRVTVLVRPETLASPSPEKKTVFQQLRALGIHFVTADLATTSVVTLADVFAQFHTVIGCTGFASGVPIQRKLCQAVLDAGVTRYVPWQFGVDYDVIGRGSAQELFDEQLDVRDLLRAQDKTDWVIISTGMFTSFLFEPALGVVDLRNHVVHALGSLDTAITVTTAEDIGRLTAEILLSEPRIRNTVVYTAGDTLSYRHFAYVLETVLGRTFQREESTVADLQEALARAPDDVLKKYRVVFAHGKGVSWDMKQTFNVQRELEVTSVEQWVRKNLNGLGF